MPELDGWDNFYVIIGSSAGALIGLQFVVITLIADIPITGRDEQASQSFGTPNVVHFGVALLISSLVVMPWHGITLLAIALGLIGFIGITYVLITFLRMRSQTAYRPVLEDWLFHALLPFTAYAILATSACCACAHPHRSLFAVGAATLLLLFIGIHNAWDTVTWHVYTRKPKTKDADASE